MAKKIIFISFVVACIGGAVWWFLIFRETKVPIDDAMKAIPTDAAFIIESKESAEFWKKLSQTNVMWEELMATNVFQNLNSQGKYIDSVINKNPNISALLVDKPIYASAHIVGDSNFYYLFAFSLPNLTYQSAFEEMIADLNTNKNKPAFVEFEKQTIGTIQPSLGKYVNYCFVNGTLIISTNIDLIKKSISQISSKKSLLNNNDFKKIVNSSGKKVDANVYVNYEKFSSIFNQFIHTDFIDETNALSSFAQYSGWDISIKPNALMLNGFTSVNDSLNNYLSVFRNQSPQNIKVTDIAPAKAAFIISYGLSNLPQYVKEQQNRKYVINKSSAISESKYDAALLEFFTQWFENEMALIINSSDSAKMHENAYACFRTIDKKDALVALNDIAASINSLENLPTDSLTYNEHYIGKISAQGILSHMFGWIYKSIENNYYTSVGDYIVFANSTDALKKMINDFETNKTLANSKNYTSFSENISAQSNVFVYSSLAKSTSYFKSFINPENAKQMAKSEDIFKKFEALAFQFTSGKDLFFSNAYLKFNPVYKKEAETIWETKLDTTISTKPYVVINHNTKSKEIVVQDDANKIYLISNTGKIIWSKQLDEKIMSDVHQIDALKNGKLQLLFNTRSAIYMFDRNGNDMKGFPIKLNSHATNPLSVFDYESNREYRIFVASSDKKINCYNAKGEQIKGYELEETNEQVFAPIQFKEINGKDHLFIVDIKGKIYVTDRKGNMKVKLKQRFTQGIMNFYVENGKDYSTTSLTACDTTGNVIKINLTDNKEVVKLRDFETSPYFLLYDINNDKMQDYVFLTRDELLVFSMDKTLIFNAQLPTASHLPPQIFLLNEGVKVGVILDSINEIYLFNSNGSLFNETPFKGKLPFSLMDLNNDGQIHLVTCNGENSIYVYSFK